MKLYNRVKLEDCLYIPRCGGHDKHIHKYLHNTWSPFINVIRTQYSSNCFMMGNSVVHKMMSCWCCLSRFWYIGRYIQMIYQLTISLELGLPPPPPPPPHTHTHTHTPHTHWSNPEGPGVGVTKALSVNFDSRGIMLFCYIEYHWK